MRDAWLQVANDVAGVTGALEWERAKTDVQRALQAAREKLILARQLVVATRRDAFNAALNGVWELLRKDRYSAFSQLEIPLPSGKGFPIEIQVKAVLDNATERREVDALRVLSESQIHVIGIAAFITRAQMLGQPFLIFDDPVQSMDEEHFRTFAGPLLDSLLDRGVQVMVLTHNETFARDVADHHAARPSYASLEIALSRRNGCQVREGNRRIRNRLKRARDAIEDGDRSEAWKLVRLAVERLYLLIRSKCGASGFDPRSWRNHTAEGMWNEAVGALVEARDASLARRLREVLTLSAAGAHDSSARGQTDLESALDVVREAAAVFGIAD